MNIIFFGTSEFAVPALQEINKNHNVIGVVTQPDRQKGRGLKVGFSPVKICACDLGLDVFQPASKVEVDAPYTSAEDDNYEGTPGKVVKGYMATQYLHPQGQTFDSQLGPLVSDLKASLEAASVYLDDIYRIDYMGVTFGETGHSFP